MDVGRPEPNVLPAATGENNWNSSKHLICGWEPKANSGTELLGNEKPKVGMDENHMLSGKCFVKEFSGLESFPWAHN